MKHLDSCSMGLVSFFLNVQFVFKNRPPPLTCYSGCEWVDSEMWIPQLKIICTHHYSLSWDAKYLLLAPQQVRILIAYETGTLSPIGLQFGKEDCSAEE